MRGGRGSCPAFIVHSLSHLPPAPPARVCVRVRWRPFLLCRYLDELVDEGACVRKLGKAARGFELGKDHKAHADVCRMLKKQTEAELERSGYNWVPTDFWRTAFDAAAAPKALPGKR